MHSPWLVFIESNTSGTGRLFARAAAREGFEPVLLAKDPARYGYAGEDGIRVIQADTQDLGAVLNLLRNLMGDRGIAGVTSSSEYYIEMVGEVTRRLALPGPNPEAIRLCRDKQAQRIRLQSAGAGVPMFTPAESTEAAVEAAKAIGLPVVVKPVNGSGSVGVKMCDRLGEVQEHASALLGQKVNERGLPLPGRILIEEMVLGPEYSVEAFGRNIIGITQKHLGPLPYFVEAGHDFPAPLSEETKSEINDAVVAAIDALGLGWGPSHSELRLTKQGVKIIEVNPRLAGGYIPELVRLAFGIDMIDETIKLVAGRHSGPEKTTSRCSSIRFIIPDRDGILLNVHNLNKAEQLSGVVEARLYSSLGNSICCYGDFRSRVGHVIAVADSVESSSAIATEARREIELVIGAK
ncbi:MAG TPA: ATP-grasp domain-containing protein [Blastocatellia bacterium]|jgi:argininosuccinate lyase|nr:ATP-grasp domain-containing protein [Blastocatellia bacterium]